MASIKIDYYKQLTHPAELVVGQKISRLGTKSFDILSILSAAALLLICLNSIFISRKSQNFKETTNDSKADLSLLIKGMTCNHCKEAVKDAVNLCNGIKDVQINLDTGAVLIYGDNIDENKIINSINESGFSVGKNL